MFACKEIKKDGQSLCSVQGALTIENSKVFHAELKKLIEKTEKIQLDLSEVTEIDLAGLQLLCAINNSRPHEQNLLTVEIKIPSQFIAAAKNAGFPGICEFNNSDCECIWRKGADL